MFCRFGSVELRRPVAATVWVRQPCIRPSGDIIFGSNETSIGWQPRPGGFACPHDLLFGRRVLYFHGPYGHQDTGGIVVGSPARQFIWGRSLKALFWKAADDSLVVEVVEAEFNLVVLVPLISTVDRVWYRFPPAHKLQ